MVCFLADTNQTYPYFCMIPFSYEFVFILDLSMYITVLVILSTYFRKNISIRILRKFSINELNLFNNCYMNVYSYILLFIYDE